MTTVATRLRGVRRFCRWLVVDGEADKAPTEGIEIATAPDKPVPILTDSEITALLTPVRRQRPARVLPGRTIAIRSCGIGRRTVILRGCSGPLSRHVSMASNL